MFFLVFYFFAGRVLYDSYPGFISFNYICMNFAFLIRVRKFSLGGLWAMNLIL